MINHAVGNMTGFLLSIILKYLLLIIVGKQGHFIMNFLLRFSAVSLHSVFLVAAPVFLVALTGPEATADSSIMNGNLIVEGREVLPYGVYVRAGGGASRVDLIENVLGPAGLDLSTSAWRSSNFRNELGSVMGAAEEDELLVFFDLFDPPQDDPIFYVSEALDSPSLAALYHSDDANLLYPDPQQVAEYDRIVKELQLNTATMTTLTIGGTATPSIVRDYAPHADLVFGQAYPLNVNSRKPADVYRSISNLVENTVPTGNVPMAVLQLHGTEDGGNDFGLLRPTPAEADVMSYLSLMAGAKGILWYEFESDFTPRIDLNQPDLWERVVTNNDEIESIENFFLFGERKVHKPDVSTDVFYATFARNDEALFVVVNAEVDAFDFEVKSDLGLLTNLSNEFSDRDLTLEFDAGMLQGTLAPMSVQVFRVVIPEPAVSTALFMHVLWLGLRRYRANVVGGMTEGCG